MTPLAEFLQELLGQGKAIVREPPTACSLTDKEAQEVLERAYAEYRLQVAGPPLNFESEAALAAGVMVHHACWFLLDHESAPAELEKNLTMPSGPQSPRQHFSADLVLRFLPQIHRRVRAQHPNDVLNTLLERVLRLWPLSGVLSTVEGGPLVPPDFGGHPGLLMLYAERWCRTEKPAWLPRGEGLEYIQLVWQEMGKDVSLRQSLERAADSAALQSKEGPG